jgi:hypothetical protein
VWYARAQPRSTKLTKKSRRKDLKSLPAGAAEPAAVDCRLMSMMVLKKEEERRKKNSPGNKGQGQKNGQPTTNMDSDRPVSLLYPFSAPRPSRFPAAAALRVRAWPVHHLIRHRFLALFKPIVSYLTPLLRTLDGSFSRVYLGLDNALAAKSKSIHQKCGAPGTVTQIHRHRTCMYPDS